MEKKKRKRKGFFLSLLLSTPLSTLPRPSLPPSRARRRGPGHRRGAPSEEEEEEEEEQKKKSSY